VAGKTNINEKFKQNNGRRVNNVDECCLSALKKPRSHQRSLLQYTKASVPVYIYTYTYIYISNVWVRSFGKSSAIVVTHTPCCTRQ